MRAVTYAAVVLGIPAVYAAALFLLLAPHLGVVEAVGALVFAAAAFIGRVLDKKFWDWGKHQVLTGQDAGRFMGKVALLHALTAAAFGLGYKACFDAPWDLPALGAAPAAVLSFLLLSFFFFSREYQPFLRGTTLLTADAARRAARLALPDGDRGFPFGGCFLPSVVSLMHFLILGAVGAGKTKILEALLRTFLPTLRTMDARAIVFDPKREFVRYLDSLALGVRVIIFDPTDARCFAWAMAQDIVDEDDAKTLAEIMVPKMEHSSQPFFDNAAGEILESVVVHLQRRKPGRWSLRDVCYCMRSMKRIKALLSTTQEGREVLDQYFSKEKTVLDVMSTIATHVGPYKTVAKAWDRAERDGRTVSIDEWMKGNFIIVLGSSNKAGPTVRDINRLFLTRVSQALLDEPDNDQADLLSPESRRHYLFLDELRFAGKLDCLSELFLKGRSKGAVLVAAVQDRKGVQANSGRLDFCLTRTTLTGNPAAAHLRMFRSDAAASDPLPSCPLPQLR